MGRIDTHQHIVPDFYAQWLADRNLNAAGFPIPAWSESAAIDALGRHDIDTAIVSVSTPGAHVGDDAEARAMARRLNEFAADLARRHPTQFGFFSTLTLPDVDGAIAEAEFAFDHLHADGVVLLANVRGEYLGDPAFDPLFDYLNSRQAVVFIHPSNLPGQGLPTVPPFMADFLLDTTRAALNLVLSGTLDRCPKLNVILSHGGGFLPYAAYRVAPFCAPGFGYEAGADVLRQFWFDTALSASPSSLPSLLAFADPARVMFGSDWPFAPDSAVGFNTGNLNTLDDATQQRINRTNAEALFPRLRCD
jgi:6-methylsalicylate decarboxylase